MNIDWVYSSIQFGSLREAERVASSIVQNDALAASEYDGPPTVRDVETEGPDTSPGTSYPTMPCVYSRSAA